MEKTREAPRRMTLWFAAAALVEFLVYYVLALLIDNYDVIYYYLYFIERFILLAFPVSAAAVLVRLDLDLKRTIIKALAFSATRFIVFIPFFYLEYVYGPYDSAEGILLSLITSVATVIIYLAVILALYAVIKLVAKHRGGGAFPLELMNFSKPEALAILIISLVIFAVNLGLEIYSTVSFFLESSGVFYISEIVLMVCSYVFLIILFIGIHALACLAANRCVKSIADDEDPKN